MKNFLYTVLAIILFTPVLAWAIPSSIDRITNHIEPLIKTDYIKATNFVASSTSATSSFPVASSTTFCLSADCRTAWPSGGGTGSNWDIVSGGLETATTTDFARAAYFVATNTNATSTFAGPVATAKETTFGAKFSFDYKTLFNPFRARTFERSGPITITEHPAANNPVLEAADVTDETAVGVADPFIIYEAGLFHMFFEVITATEEKIGHATSSDGLVWNYNQVVIDDGLNHLAYPLVFKDNGVWYMTPDRSTNDIEIWTTSSFPTGWTIAEVATTTPYLVSDATPVFWNGRWYMFVQDGTASQKRLLVADEGDSFTGRTWSEHPSSPIITTGNTGVRMGGRPIVHDDYIDMVYQDLSQVRTRSYRVTNLTPTSFSHYELPTSPLTEAAQTGTEWNSFKMHHVDAMLPFVGGPSIVAVDGNVAGSGNVWSIGIYTIGADVVHASDPSATSTFSGFSLFKKPVTVKNLGSTLSFLVEDEATDATPFVISNGGDVGIGNSAPASKLFVTGSIRQNPVASAGLTNYMRTNAANTSTTTDLNAGILAYYTSGVNAYGMDLGYNTDYRLRLFAPTSKAISFAFVNTTPTAQSHFTEKMVLTSAGNLGIGTTTPATQLQVTGVAGTNPFRVASSSNTSMFEIKEDGNVGIGTTTPSEKLTVVGTTTTTGLSIASLTGFLKATAGAVSTALVNLASDVTGTLGVGNGGTGLTSTGASSTILSTNGTNPVWVGGNTLCVAITGSADLCDGGDASGGGGGSISTSTDLTNTYALYATAANTFGDMQTSTDAVRWMSGTGNTFLVGTSSASSAKFEVNNQDSTSTRGNVRLISKSASGADYDIRIDSPDADIEFCDAASAPEGCFEINSVMANNQLYITPRNAGNTSFADPIFTVNRTTGTGAANIGIGTRYDTPEATLEIAASTTDTNILALTSAQGATAGDKLILKRSGFLGLGQSTPNVLLHLATTSGSATHNFITLQNTGAFAEGGTGMLFQNSAGSVDMARLYARPGSSYTDASLAFQVANSSKVLTERMRIDVDGDLGIGTTTPASKLTVVGGAQFTGLANCDTIDTDANGILSCGTDATGGGGGSSNWDIVSGGLETGTTTDFARANYFVATGTNSTSTFANAISLGGSLNATGTIESAGSGQALRIGDDIGSGLEYIFSTVGDVIIKGYGAVTELIVAIAETIFQGNVRITGGLFVATTTYNGATTSDALVIDGYTNSGEWIQEFCTSPAAEVTQIAADTLKGCNRYTYIEDANGVIDFVTPTTGTSTYLRIRTGASGTTNVAGDGMGIGWASGLDFGDIHKSKPAMEWAMRTDAMGNATSSIMVMGITDKLGIATDFATEPAQGIYVIASSTTGNYQLACNPSTGGTTYVNTGIATTTVTSLSATTNNPFVHWRLEIGGTSNTAVTTVLKARTTSNQNFTQVGTCTIDTSASTQAVAPTIGNGRVSAGTLSAEIHLMFLKFWYKQPVF